jgi:hypothetical protein
MDYRYKDTEYHFDKALVEKWMEREGITEGEGLDAAMDHIMVTAEGWIRAEGKPVTKEALVQAAEEAMREEIRLTGGSV